MGQASACCAAVPAPAASKESTAPPGIRRETYGSSGSVNSVNGLPSPQVAGASAASQQAPRSALAKADEKRNARRPRKHIALRLDGRDFGKEYEIFKSDDCAHPRDSFGHWDDAVDKNQGDKKLYRTVLTLQKETLLADMDDGLLWSHIAQLRTLGLLHDAFCDLTSVVLVFDVDSIRDSPILRSGAAVTEKAVATWARSAMSRLQRCHEQGILLGASSLDRVVGTSMESAELVGIGILGRLVTGPWTLQDAQQVEADTLAFTAPELLEGTPGLVAASDLSDAWTVGMLIYSLLQGGPPVNAKKLGTQKTRQTMTQFVPQFKGDVWEVVSEPCRVLLQGLLCPAPSKRWSIGYALRESQWLNPRATDTGGCSVLNTLEGFQSQARSFKAGDKLWRATRHLAAEGLPRTGVLDLEKTFREFDRNGDGVLSIAEVRAGLKRHSSSLPVDLEKLLGGLDANNSGDIDINEWIAALLEECDFRDEEALLAAFRKFDVDMSGKINRVELVAALQNTAAWSQLQGDDGVDRLLKRADVDGDGQISYAEFINVMRMEAQDDADEMQRQRPPVALSILERMCSSPCSPTLGKEVVKQN